MVATAPPRYRRSWLVQSRLMLRLGCLRAGGQGLVPSESQNVRELFWKTLKRSKLDFCLVGGCCCCFVFYFYYFFIFPPVSIFHASAEALASRDSCFIAECLWLRFLLWLARGGLLGGTKQWRQQIVRYQVHVHALRSFNMSFV